jgi:hypothetical protein
VEAGGVTTLLRKLYLLAAGIIAVGLGGAMLLAPVGFYAGYGLELIGEVTLLNEMRSHGLFMMAVGGFMAAGGLRDDLASRALLVAATFYLAYAGSRVLAMALDGLPDAGLVLASVLEGAIGLLALALLVLGSRKRLSAATA